MAERWTDDSIKMVRWVPWNRYKDAGDADGEVPECVPADERVDHAEGAPKVVFTETRERAPREFFSFESRMRNDAGSPEVAEDAAVGSECWVDNHIRNPVVKG